MYLRLSTALSATFLLLLPAGAAEVSPEVERILSCGVIFSLRSEDAKAAGDEGGATEWFYRGDELTWRGRGMLEQAGFAASEIDNIVDNNALMTGLSVGLGDPPYSDDDCLALSE